MRHHVLFSILIVLLPFFDGGACHPTITLPVQGKAGQPPNTLTERIDPRVRGVPSVFSGTTDDYAKPGLPYGNRDQVSDATSPEIAAQQDTEDFTTGYGTISSENEPRHGTHFHEEKDAGNWEDTEFTEEEHHQIRKEAIQYLLTFDKKISSEEAGMLRNIKTTWEVTPQLEEEIALRESLIIKTIREAARKQREQDYKAIHMS